jgi:hypothetical protein
MGTPASALLPPQEAKSGLLGDPGRALEKARARLRDFGMTHILKCRRMIRVAVQLVTRLTKFLCW